MPNDKGEVLSAQATKTRDLRKKQSEFNLLDREGEKSVPKKVRVNEKCERCHWFDGGNCYGEPKPVKRTAKNIGCRFFQRVRWE